MRVLFICKDNPFGTGGADFATHAYLKSFSELCDGNIDVFMASYIKEDDSIKVANYYKVPERSLFDKVLSFYTGQMHRNVRPVLRHLKKDSKYDYCVFNNSKTSGGLIDVVKSYGIKIITIHHNYEKEYYVDNARNPIYKYIFAQHVRCNEKKSYFLSDYNLFLTDQDRKKFESEYGRTEGATLLIGAFEFRNLPVVVDKKFDNNKVTIAITGSLCTVQGIDGITYFFKELFDSIPQSSEIIISGRSPAQEIIQLCESKPNVHLIPNPDSMDKVIEKADIYVCPTRLGGGLKLRVMDGLRLGIPVITHTCSARGYDPFIGTEYLYVFSTKDEFKNAFNQLLEAYQNGRISRPVLRSKYEECFSYEAGFARLSKFFMNE